MGPGVQLAGMGSHGGGKDGVRCRVKGYPGALLTQAGDPTNPGAIIAGAPQKRIPLNVDGRAEVSTSVNVCPSPVVSFRVIVSPCLTWTGWFGEKRKSEDTTLFIWTPSPPTVLIVFPESSEFSEVAYLTLASISSAGMIA